MGILHTRLPLSWACHLKILQPPLWPGSISLGIVLEKVSIHPTFRPIDARESFCSSHICTWFVLCVPMSLLAQSLCTPLLTLLHHFLHMVPPVLHFTLHTSPHFALSLSDIVPPVPLLTSLYHFLHMIPPVSLLTSLYHFRHLVPPVPLLALLYHFLHMVPPVPFPCNIYLGINIISGWEVTIKRESVKAKHPQLE